MSCEVKAVLSKRDVNTLVRRKFLKSDFDMMIFDGWHADKSVKAYYLHGEDGKLASVALMSRCDFDPLGVQTKPMVLNYIYTVKDKRRKGYGSKLLDHIKTKEEFSAFTSSPESDALFTKNGCTRVPQSPSPHNLMFRWPQL